MALATILAVLAFAIALVALWLTSDIVKKVEGQNEKFLRAHLSSLREEIRDLDKALGKTTKISKGHTEVQVLFDKRLNDHTKELSDIRERIALLADQFEELDRSIPSRYRVRVVKADPTPAGKSQKPSIQ
ncbi:hypothetical protein [Magnetovibrio sp.]|uniref:hypothetical protein n=1 Tax=Magnetovibrio sp. TaxID=2024836 RepID=UPI002F92C73F